MHVNLQPLPPKWRAGVASFLERFHALYGLDCAILYGSMATGNYHARSDIDLVLISCGVPGDFWQRMKAVSNLYERGVPIEALAYTPQEFKQMIENMHVTALDATTQGIPLANPVVFDGLREQTAILERKGLRRGRHAWVMDAPREQR